MTLLQHEGPRWSWLVTWDWSLAAVGIHLGSHVWSLSLGPLDAAIYRRGSA